MGPAPRPLVTFAVIAYNQERFIRAAIKGAFAQTYQPLEIVLSDDGSPDRTYQIMQEMAAAYDGPHKVVLNRNPVNLGLVPHVDRVMGLVSGDFIVVNAGDDVSVPERTAILADTWLGSARTVKLVHSAARRIGLDGVPYDIRRPPAFMQGTPDALEIVRGKGFVIGSTAAWDRGLYTEFGPLGAGLSTEDTILPLRATLTGRIGYIDRALVNWRDGGVSQEFSGFDARDRLYGFKLKARKWWAEIYAHLLTDPVLERCPQRRQIEALCKHHAPGLQFIVDLAMATRGARLRMLPRALRLAFTRRSAIPVKYWLCYSLDRPYIALANRLRGKARRPPRNRAMADPGP